MKTGTVRQILLITDGCSNYGEDPQVVAAFAKEQGITVNVIGVMQNDIIDERAREEIEGIATQGGGISQIVYTEVLSQTVQMVTRQAMTQTLQGIVNQELKQILNKDITIEELPPEQRGEIMEVVDELNETVDLEVVILVDTSASMTKKLPTVKEALLDLSLSLSARAGNNQFSLLVFPGKKKYVEKLFDWSPRLDTIPDVFAKLIPGGMTPTGPALQEAIQHFHEKRSFFGLLKRSDDSYHEESV